ncbi:MAG: flavin reductase family protein [Candidatus Riflebacteria bacterium]|nr:flavin reductase family protein [Candidatus Riflebacteria bacterium]
MKRSFGPKTIIFPTPTWVICTWGKNGKPNAMAAAWGGICCSKPPCVGVSLRKATETYSNLMEKKAFTVNVPSENLVKFADYFGMVSGRDEDKISVKKLTPIKSNLVDAPYLDEFPMILECKVIQTVEIGLHTQFIGEIMDVKVDNECLDSKELPDMEKIKPLIYAPEIRKYYTVGKYLGEAFSIGKS